MSMCSGEHRSMNVGASGGQKSTDLPGAAVTGDGELPAHGC